MSPTQRKIWLSLFFQEWDMKKSHLTLTQANDLKIALKNIFIASYKIKGAKTIKMYSSFYLLYWISLRQVSKFFFFQVFSSKKLRIIFQVFYTFKIMFDKSIQVCSRYQHLELTFCQRLQSLKLQVDSIADNEEQQEMIETLSKIHIEQKAIRGDRLLQEQCQLLRDKQRKQELQTYEKRILDLRYLQMRKEQQLWDQTWVGKRVKYSCLFQLNRVQLDQEHDQAILLMSQLIRKNAVEKQIEKLSQCLKKEQKMVEEADFRRVEKKELELLFQEHQKNEKLTALCSQLESQLQQISSEHEDFIHKYKSLTSTMSQIEAQTSGSSDKEYSCGGSGKTISTTSEEQN